MTREFRRFARRRVEVEIRSRDLLGLGELFFDSVDLSAGGAFLRSDILFEEGEPLELEVRLPHSSIRAAARVAWVRRVVEDGEPGMGVEFARLSDVDRRALEDFLQSPE